MQATRNRFAAMVMVVMLTWGTPAAAQSADQEAVVQVVHDLFDGMREKDANKIRGVFAPGARLGGYQRDSVTYTTAEDFAMRIGNASVHINERIWDWEVRIDGNLATLWTKYDVLIDGNFSHCGVDAFQLFHTLDGWKIFHLADTRRREECWTYPGG